MAFPLCQQDFGDTYLPRQLSEQPSEPVINVLLIGFDLEEQTEKQEVG